MTFFGGFLWAVSKVFRVSVRKLKKNETLFVFLPFAATPLWRRASDNDGLTLHISTDGWDRNVNRIMIRDIDPIGRNRINCEPAQRPTQPSYLWLERLLLTVLLGFIRSSLFYIILLFIVLTLKNFIKKFWSGYPSISIYASKFWFRSVFFFLEALRSLILNWFLSAVDNKENGVYCRFFVNLLGFRRVFTRQSLIVLFWSGSRSCRSTREIDRQYWMGEIVDYGLVTARQSVGRLSAILHPLNESDSRNCIVWRLLYCHRRPISFFFFVVKLYLHRFLFLAIKKFRRGKGGAKKKKKGQKHNRRRRDQSSNFLMNPNLETRFHYGGKFSSILRPSHRTMAIDLFPTQWRFDKTLLVSALFCSLFFFPVNGPGKEKKGKSYSEPFCWFESNRTERMLAEKKNPKRVRLNPSSLCGSSRTTWSTQTLSMNNPDKACFIKKNKNGKKSRSG